MEWKNSFGEKFAQIPVKKGGGNFGVYWPKIVQWDLIKGIRSLFSIGGGKGELEAFAAKNLGLELGYLDPSPNLVQDFRENLKEYDVSEKSVEIFEQRFQDFNPTRTYDLIISIHSWYYVGNGKEPLEKALSMLSPKGNLYIIFSMSNCFSKRFVKKFGIRSVYHAEELDDTARSLGLSYKFEVLKEMQPREKFLDDQGVSPSGWAWISYMLREDSAQFSDIKKKEITDFFLNAYAKGENFYSDGHFIFSKQNL